MSESTGRIIQTTSTDRKGSVLGIPRSLFPVAAVASTVLIQILESACTGHQAIQQFVIPNPASENMGLGQADYERFLNIKADFVNHNQQDQIYNLDQTQNSPMSAQDIIARDISSRIGQNITAEQVNFNAENVNPFWLNIANNQKVNFVPVSVNLEVEGSDQVKQLLFMFAQYPGGEWGQVGFLTTPPTSSNTAGSSSVSYLEFLDLSFGDSQEIAGLISPAGPENFGMINFAKVGDKAAMVVNLPNVVDPQWYYLSENGIFSPAADGGGSGKALFKIKQIDFSQNGIDITPTPPIPATVIPENPYANVDLMNVSTIPNTEYFQTGVWPTADIQIAQAPYFDAANSKFLIEHGVSETEVAKMTEYERFLQTAIIANENNIIPPVSLDLVYRMLQDTPQLGAISENGFGIQANTKWSPEHGLFGQNYTLPTFNRDLLVTYVPFGKINAEGAIVVKYADNISGLIAYYHTDDGQLRFVPLRMIDKQITVNQMILMNVPGTPSYIDTLPESKYYISNLTGIIYEDGLAYDGQELAYANQQRLARKGFTIDADEFGIDPQTGLQILMRIYGSLNP